MNDNSLYRASGNVKNIDRTHVSDIYQQALTDIQTDSEAYGQTDALNERSVTLQNRQIIGVMYSISAGINGELFPIYIGRNTIGSDFSCDICLREMSVSGMHGILLAREQVNDSGEKYINVSLSDDNSMYGIYVNDERAGFERVTLQDGDIVSIGMNYVFVISLFNAKGKLTVAHDFQPMEEDLSTTNYGGVPSNDKLPQSSPATRSAQQHQQGSGTFGNKQQQQQNNASASDFYKPSKDKNIDHYNSETIIL